VTTPLIHATLVHWNAPDWCAESARSLLQSSGVEVRVLVVDNSGTMVEVEGVDVSAGHGNIGFAAAANLGLTCGLESGADYLFVGCHDITLQPDALALMVEQLGDDPGLGIVGPVLNGAGATEADLDWVNGSGFLLRRELAAALRFDERFETYVEDVDFCYRARDLGWRVGRCGEALASTTGSVDASAATVLMHANTLVFFARRHMAREFLHRVAYLLRRPRPDHLHAFALGMARIVAFPLRRSDRISRSLTRTRVR
jgi:GT2 family glycosyltransferase